MKWKALAAPSVSLFGKNMMSKFAGSELSIEQEE